MATRIRWACSEMQRQGHHQHTSTAKVVLVVEISSYARSSNWKRLALQSQQQGIELNSRMMSKKYENVNKKEIKNAK